MSEVDNERPRIIVADPDPEASALLSRQLEWAGYDVTTAANGRDALDLICRLKPAAAVLEVKMEILTGYEVVRQMREDDRTRLVPVVMISARAGKLDRDFAFTVGADDYVKKPFRSAELIARLALLAPSPHAPKKPQLEPVPAGTPAAAAKPSPLARPRRTFAPLALAR
jgi:CheY-like chemotaxis protein